MTSVGFSSTEQFEFDQLDTQQLPHSGSQPDDAAEGETRSPKSGSERFRLYDSTEIAASEPAGRGTSRQEGTQSSFPLPNKKEDAQGERPDEPVPFLLTMPKGLSTQSSRQDPIQEAPNKIWYVRHPDRAEQGPLNADEARQMLHDGGIDAKSIVWREDWEDWQPAADVFRELSGETAPPGSSQDQLLAQQQHNSEADDYIYRRKSNPGGAIIWRVVAITLGIATIVVLCLALYHITSN